LEEESFSLKTDVAGSLKPFIDQLTHKYKEAIHMTEFEDVSQMELARRLYIPYSGAKSRGLTGKRKIKKTSFCLLYVPI
jgi:RNA polymerase sigma-70 factor, ECF subfamily